MIEVAAQWMDFGLALGVAMSDLKTISSEHKSHPKSCLREVVLTWLKKKYNVQENGPPTWKLLCSAVRARGGADNPALADRIESKMMKHV